MIVNLSELADDMDVTIEEVFDMLCDEVGAEVEDGDGYVVDDADVAEMDDEELDTLVAELGPEMAEKLVWLVGNLV